MSRKSHRGPSTYPYPLAWSELQVSNEHDETKNNLLRLLTRGRYWWNAHPCGKDSRWSNGTTKRGSDWTLGISTWQGERRKCFHAGFGQFSIDWESLRRNESFASNVSSLTDLKDWSSMSAEFCSAPSFWTAFMTQGFHRVNFHLFDPLGGFSCNVTQDI